MANEEHLAILKQGVEAWNRWRMENVDVALHNRVNLSGAKIGYLNLSGANLSGVNLSHADLGLTILPSTDLSRANLSGANLNDGMISISQWRIFGDVKWNENTKWENVRGLDTAFNMPEALRQQLGM